MRKNLTKRLKKFNSLHQQTQVLKMEMNRMETNGSKQESNPSFSTAIKKNQERGKYMARVLAIWQQARPLAAKFCTPSQYSKAGKTLQICQGAKTSQSCLNRIKNSRHNCSNKIGNSWNNFFKQLQVQAVALI